MDETNQSNFREFKGYNSHYQLNDEGNPAKELFSQYRASKTLHFHPHDVIYHEGLSADAIYVLTKGLVKLISYLPNGRARIVRLHGPASIIGLGGIIEMQYEHTAVAVYDVEVLKIPSNSIRQIKDTDPGTFVQISEKWYEYLRAADTWITQFSTGSIKARVARLVTYLAFLEKGSNGDYVKLLNGEDMASILGVTPESVSRVLAEFKRQNILQSVNGKHHDLFKRNIEQLEEIALD